MMKHVRYAISLSTSRQFILIVSCLLLAVSCGSQTDGDAGPGPLSISIITPTAAESQTLSARETSLVIGGSVSESPRGKATEAACNCVGFQCFFDPQCITVYVPRVHVTVTNQANGESSRATLAFNSSAQDEKIYQWTASISLAAGQNRIVATADDGAGNQGSDAVVLANP